MFYQGQSAAHAINSLSSSQESKLRSRRNARLPRLEEKALPLALEEPAIDMQICAVREVQPGARLASLVASRETTVKPVSPAASIPECLPTSMTTRKRELKNKKVSPTSQTHLSLDMVLIRVESPVSSSELWRSYHCTRKAGRG